MATKLANHEVVASSKSLNKTIKEIDSLIDNNPISADSQLRKKLHEKLYELLEQEAVHWYRKGFKRGHITCHNKRLDVPKKISQTMLIRRDAYIKKEGIEVELYSRIKDEL